MRTQLESIERIEKYLNNELNSADHATFEKELASSPELRTLLENVKDLQAAAFRHELRKKIESNAGGTTNWGAAAIIGVLIMALAILAWLFFVSPKASSNKEPEPSVVERVTTVFKADTTNSAPIVESAPSPSSKSLFQKVLDVFSPVENDTSNVLITLGGHELWTEPDIQSFQFQSKNGATIEGKDGMLIIVPEQAFVDETGHPVTGKVEFNLLEAFGVEQMVLYKLQTISNGSNLESGGMFYIEASIAGKPVQINPERPLYVEIPTAEKKAGMMGFEGAVDSAGNMNWINPKPLKKYLVKLPLAELDFLPSGFEGEVKANMPFLKYKQTSPRVTDSLYYSIGQYTEFNEATELEDESSRKWGKTRRREGDRALIVRGGVENSDSLAGPSLPNCGIKPVSIETITHKKFAQTFVATKEFEARIALLHQESNGNDLLEIYLKNLTEDLHVSDSLVALKANANSKSTFRALAKEKLTNVKDAPLYQKRLSDYYTQKRRELQNSRERLATQLATKNAKELESLFQGVTKQSKPETANTVGDLARALPPPTAATTNVYSMQWMSMGWGNIDRYYKLLNNGTIETPIAIVNSQDNASVTQWLGDINTYTGLIGNGTSYVAVFPKKKRSRSTQTHVFAIAENGRQFSWGMKHYDPYEDAEVQFEMATASIADIKHDLKGVDANYGQLRKQMVWRERQAKAAIIRANQLRKKQETWLKERKDVIAKYKRALRKQKEVESVMNKLTQAAFPCQNSNINVIESDAEVDIQTEEEPGPDFFTIVEDMPVFPGGDAALLQYVSDNLVYPQEALTNGFVGTIYVSYVVNESGGVTNVRAIRGGNPALNAEAVRVIESLPNHIPGMQRGKPVSVQFTLPIRFGLE